MSHLPKNVKGTHLPKLNLIGLNKNFEESRVMEVLTLQIVIIWRKNISLTTACDVCF